jgi:hypothetical protein
MRIAAIEITNTVGGVSQKTRYELEGGEQVSLWIGSNGKAYIIPKCLTEDDARAFAGDE